MIITVANHKGGVAKTSTVLAVAEIITYMQENDPDFLPEEYRQKPVLVIDIDPQANATEALGTDPAEVKISVQDFLEMPEKTLEIADVRYGILKTKFENIHLIPSCISIEPFVHRLAGEMDGAMRLSVVTKYLRDRYCMILIDTPPNLGLFTQNALVAADGVLVPISLNKHAIMGIQNLMSMMSDVFDTVIPTQAKVAENISKKRNIFFGLTLQQKDEWLNFIREFFERTEKLIYPSSAKVS